ALVVFRRRRRNSVLFSEWSAGVLSCDRAGGWRRKAGAAQRQLNDGAAAAFGLDAPAVVEHDRPQTPGVALEAEPVAARVGDVVRSGERRVGEEVGGRRGAGEERGRDGMC